MKQTALWGVAVLAIAIATGCNQTSTTQGSASTATGSTTTGAATTPAAAPDAQKPAAAPDAQKPATTPDAQAPAGNEVTLAGGLKYTDLKVGDGDIAEDGLLATVHYTGWLTDGTKFDSSVDRGQPFQFRIGAHNVIAGWDQGVKGMRIGGKRHLTIPPDMGYGANGYPPTIPANATLVFDIELLALSH